jgi:hypothetical protein
MGFPIKLFLFLNSLSLYNCLLFFPSSLECVACAVGQSVNEQIDDSTDFSFQIQFLQFIGLAYQGKDIVFRFTWAPRCHTTIDNKLLLTFGIVQQ